jgi:arginyl-tRNA synthetase
MTAGSQKAADQNIYVVVLERVLAACSALATAGVLPAGLDYCRVVVEPPRDPDHGDMATNAAMVLAKDAGGKPRQLADAIAAKLRADDLMAKVEVAGPGFINLTLKPSAWIAALRSAVRSGPDYGRGNVGAGRKINIEFVSANPTGPMHIGHCRGAVFGDALANVLAFSGFDVTREFYTNDAGAQVDVLARSAYLRYREALGETITIPDGLYPGDYLKECGAELASDYGAALKDQTEAEWLPVVRERAINMMVAEIRNDLMALGVVHDVFFSERSLVEGGLNFEMMFSGGGLVEQAGPAVATPPTDQVAATIEQLRKAGYIYEGRLQPPKGSSVEDWEDREQTLFRSTQFGDDVDRPLKKSDGGYTYFASDIAYHKNKIDRGFLSMIDVWGADHGGYVKRMQAAVRAISGGKADLDVKLIQLVRLLRAGEPVKMSKRAGDLVLSREVVSEVGRDAVRFMMLYRKNDATLDFDLAKVVEQSRENPVFYVQYGHARGQSVFRNARDVLPDLPQNAAARRDALAGAELHRLDDAAELALIRRIAQFPRLVEAAASAHEPHRIAFYLYEIASEFHAQWTRGTNSPHLRFIIQNDPMLTAARLAMVQGVVNVLAAGLALLGVDAPDEMR